MEFVSKTIKVLVGGGPRVIGVSAHRSHRLGRGKGRSDAAKQNMSRKIRLFEMYILKESREQGLVKEKKEERGKRQKSKRAKTTAGLDSRCATLWAHLDSKRGDQEKETHHQSMR